MSVRMLPDRHDVASATPGPGSSRAALRWVWPVALIVALVGNVAPVLADVPPLRGVAAVVLAVLLVGGAVPRLAPLGDRAGIALSLAAVLGGTLLPVVLGPATVLWAPYVAVAYAAGLRAPLWGRLSAALAPVVIIVVDAWPIQDLWLMLVEIIAAGLVFGLIQLRLHARENAELAAAQHEVIIMERARLVAAERQREVAAEVHDVLAHTLSGLIITLQGAGLTARAEGASPALTDQLTAATTLAKDGLSGARRAVESLHRAADAETAGSDAELPRWVAETVERLRSTTDAPIEVSGDAATVPPGWGDLVRATVLEGLTNSLRHAVGRPIKIMITGEGVTVVSVGHAERFADRGHASGGYGLTGLAERVERRGGTLSHGPTADGYELAVRFGARPEMITR